MEIYVMTAIMTFLSGFLLYKHQRSEAERKEIKDAVSRLDTDYKVLLTRVDNMDNTVGEIKTVLTDIQTDIKELLKKG